MSAMSPDHVDWWVPESPEKGGIYAQKGGLSVVTTHDIHKALYFTTQAACQKWCDENPEGLWVPRLHRILL